MVQTLQNPRPAGAESTDAVIRRRAAEQLSSLLTLSSGLLARCDTLAAEAKGERANALFAAARLIHASADATRALTAAALGETRHRRITETIVTPRPRDAVGEALDATLAIIVKDTHALAVEQNEEWEAERASYYKEKAEQAKRNAEHEVERTAYLREHNDIAARQAREEAAAALDERNAAAAAAPDAKPATP